MENGPGAAPWMPLRGIRIADFSAQLPGPLATSVFVDLGATVVKIEPVGGEFGRQIPGGMFQRVNRGKCSIALDLKDQSNREIIERLVRKSDIVIEGFRPGVAARLGIDYETLQRLKSDLIYCSISGYGQSGPWSQRPGHDLAYLAVTGMLSLGGTWKEPPQRSGLAVGDLAGAMVGVISLLAALRERDQHGTGCCLDLSLYEAALYFTSTRTAFDKDTISRGHLIPTNDVFETSDGARLALTLVEDHFWAAFAQIAVEYEPELGRPEFTTQQGRMERGDQLFELLVATFRRRTAAEWLELFEGTDVPVELCLTPYAAARTEHAQARQLLISGPESQMFCKFPAALANGSRAGVEDVGISAPGADAAQILADLGFDHDEIASLVH